jgi:hypothetical protein
MVQLGHFPYPQTKDEAVQIRMNTPTTELVPDSGNRIAAPADGGLQVVDGFNVPAPVALPSSSFQFLNSEFQLQLYLRLP